MRLSIERKNIKIYPDVKRVITRFFFAGEQRARQIVERIAKMDQEQVLATVLPVLQEYSKRHRNITKIFYRHYQRLQDIFSKIGITYDTPDNYRKLLIGSFFTHEYSIESAAFFNPSMVEDPDQSELEEGQKRVIVSFRAVGEGHISSIAFRRALLEKDGNVKIYPVGNHVDEAEIIYSAAYKKSGFFAKASNHPIDPAIIEEVSAELKEDFDFNFLKKIITQKISTHKDDLLKKLEYEKILWLADSYYEITFSLDTDLSDRVIFPISEFERNGIEDARFVRFTEDNGDIAYM
ncbi:MAG: glycosidase, partial [Cyclobacteriaceae bacterium]